jgi:hypothetical protein
MAALCSTASRPVESELNPKSSVIRLPDMPNNSKVLPMPCHMMCRSIIFDGVRPLVRLYGLQRSLLGYDVLVFGYGKAVYEFVDGMSV